MALRLRELNPETDYAYVCTPTGNELPELWEHWKLLREKLGSLTAVVGGTLESLIAEEGMIPNWRARFCTRKLKIEPYAAWLMKQSAKHDEIHSYVGIRADEEGREAGDYAAVPGVQMHFPMREWGWGIAQVLGYLAEQGVTIPQRTDCALCFYQKLSEWWRLWKDYPWEYERGIQIETRMGHTFRSPGRDTWPASLLELRKRFEAGDVPKGADVQRDLIGEMKCRVCRI